MSEKRSSNLNEENFANILYKMYDNQRLESKDFVTIVHTVTPIIMWVFQNVSVETSQVEIKSEGETIIKKNRRKKK